MNNGLRVPCSIIGRNYNNIQDHKVQRLATSGYSSSSSHNSNNQRHLANKTESFLYYHFGRDGNLLFSNIVLAKNRMKYKLQLVRLDKSNSGTLDKYIACWEAKHFSEFTKKNRTFSNIFKLSFFINRLILLNLWSYEVNKQTVQVFRNILLTSLHEWPCTVQYCTYCTYSSSILLVYSK